MELTLQSLGNIVLNGFDQIAKMLESLVDGYEVLAYNITEIQDVLQRQLSMNENLTEIINIMTHTLKLIMYQSSINSFFILIILFYLVYQHFTRK